LLPPQKEKARKKRKKERKKERGRRNEKLKKKKMMMGDEEGNERGTKWGREESEKDETPVAKNRYFLERPLQKCIIQCRQVSQRHNRAAFNFHAMPLSS
jgi:hypothetical protein